MKSSKALCGLAVVLTTTLTLLAIGCGDSEVAGIVAENNKTNIQKVANAYVLFQSRQGKAVSSKEELIEFIQTSDRIAENLEFMNIDRDKFSEMFVSERDDEEFFIRWGVFVPGRSVSQPLVFESTGVDGVKQVCYSDARVEEPSADEYEKLKSNGVKAETIDAEGNARK